MIENLRNPRILIVTPEVTYLPYGMGNLANFLTAKAGGLADVSAALVSALFEQGADVHVALPDYCAVFSDHMSQLLVNETKTILNRMPEERVHLAEDRAFYYQHSIYSNYDWENTKMALAFQREVINNIIPRVRPDLIHCNDWMTGLIPALARQWGIPCLFTIHNIYTVKCPLAYIEDRGIDAASFWQHLYFQRMAYNYQQTRESNPVDFLASGVFAAHFVNTVSPTFLEEVATGHHDFVHEALKQELANKLNEGCAVGILNAPAPSFNPKADKHLVHRYSSNDHVDGKKKNKRFLQKKLGLIEDDRAPIFFWPSRLDNIQKGCQLLAEIFYHVVSSYWEQNLEIVFVANGEFKEHFEDIVRLHHLFDRVAIRPFEEGLARLAYAASDFVLMPSLFEPCGLPQMIGPIYGSFPVVHDTGGIHDTVGHLDVNSNTGNGFLFKHFDSNGLFWAIKEAMKFYNLPSEIRESQIGRIMTQSAATFNYAVTARKYIDLYEKMLQRPLIGDVQNKMIEAVQALIREIQELKARVATLESKIGGM